MNSSNKKYLYVSGFCFTIKCATIDEYKKRLPTLPKSTEQMESIILRCENACKKYFENSVA